MDIANNRRRHLLIIALLLYKRKLLLQLLINRKKERRYWVKPHNSLDCRNNFGAYNKLFCYFKMTDHEEFFEFTRMTIPQFDKLHKLIASRLRKNSRREPLSTEIRLAMTLSFLAHGDSVATTAWHYRIGKSTVYQIIPEVCTAIWEVLQPLYLQCPHTEEEWIKIADDFNEIWNFPNCIGAIDGKHCRIQAPPNSGSAFHNYKGFFSLVLMGIADAHYRFVWVDIGDYGSDNDSGIWGNTVMCQALQSNTISVPPPRNLPNTDIAVPFALVGDEGFPLKTYLMRPYSRKQLLSDKPRIFNYRLSRARRVVENAFGILVSRWKILEKPLGLKLQSNEAIVQAVVCLHNYIITTNIGYNRYLYENREMSNCNNGVQDLGRIGANVGSVASIKQRDTLAEYFLSREGSIYPQWQYTIQQQSTLQT